MIHEQSRFDLPVPHLWPVLFALVSVIPGQGKTALLCDLRGLRVAGPNGKLVDSPGLGTMLDELQRSGWIVLRENNNHRLLCVADERRNAVLQLLLSQPDGPLFLRTQLSHQGPLSSRSQPSQTRILQDFWLCLLLGDSRTVQVIIDGYHLYVPYDRLLPCHPMQQLQSDAQGLAVLEQLEPVTRQLLLEDHLTIANAFIAPAEQSYRMATQLLEQGQGQRLCMQVLLQAWWRGDWAQLQRLSKEGAGLISGAVDHLVRGQIDPLLVLLRGFIASLPKTNSNRAPELLPIINAMYCLALFAENDPKRHSALKKALKQGIAQGFGGAYGALYHYLHKLQAANSSESIDLPDSFDGFESLLHALALYWLDEQDARTKRWCTTLQEWRDQRLADGYLWVAAELDALLVSQFALAPALADYHQSHGMQPLLQLCQRQESWQLALQALTRLKPGQTNSVNKEAKTSRLVWLINMGRGGGLTLEPREQKLGAKGQWSKGRAVALRRLQEDADTLDFLCEQDLQVSRLIQSEQTYYYGATHYHIPADKALVKLVGHPALFWADAPDVRIDLQLGEPSLHLQTRNAMLHLHLEPSGISRGEIFVHKETLTRLVVYPVSHELRQIGEIIGEGLCLPQSAKQQLVEAVSAIAPLLSIHSDIPELAAHVELIDADQRLYAHLLPLAEGLRLQLLVRPLNTGSWFRPGQGAEQLLGEQDGKTVQVRRNLAFEKQSVTQVLAACPSLASAESDDHEWRLQEPQDALQLLTELQRIDGQLLQSVWPEGERMRIKGHSNMAQLKLGLTQQGDWLQLQGGITLDDGKVLQLRSLLTLLQASPGRFIKLADNDWLAIGSSLRKRLEELGHLAERINDQGLRLSSLATPLLAELAEEVGEFKAGKEWQQQLERLNSLRDYQPPLPSTLQTELRDYQHEGFTWMARLARWGVGACLADDMGLGKTVQTLALLLLRAGDGPQLVVAPTSVTLNWLNEARRFAPTLQLHNYHQRRSLTDLGPRDLLISSYGLLQQDSEAFAGVRWSTVVLDEAQAIKNAQTKRSQAAMLLQADFRLLATGTPLENHLGELWNLFRFINPGLLGSQDSFTQRFANPIENGDGAARRALKQLIQPFLLRRLKSQVLDELPARTEITYSVPLSDDEAHQYEALRQQAVENISTLRDQQSSPLQVLAEITRLRRFCCHPSLVLPDSPLLGSKLQAFQEIVSELLENRHKALVFSQFVDHLNIVRGWLEQQGIDYQYLDGSTPAKARQRAVDAFQSGEGDLFLISLKAGGSGLNLTAADYVIHLDPWWNPAVEDQASDRAHRMGQQRPVTIYRLVTEATIEQQIVALHGRKRDLADSLLDGGNISAKLDADALLELLKGAAGG